MTTPDFTIDRFADALSEHDAFAKPPREGGSVAEASRRVGVSRQYGRTLLLKMQRDIGWQAT